MRVKNVGRILFPKAVELERDIYPGESSAVVLGAEHNQRLSNAISSGILEVAVEVPNANTPPSEYKGATKNVQIQGGNISVPEGNDPNSTTDFGSPAVGPSFIRESFPPAAIASTKPRDEFEEFSHRKGGSKAKFIEQMNDLNALRKALAATKGAKIKAALEARISTLGAAPQTFNV